MPWQLHCQGKISISYVHGIRSAAVSISVLVHVSVFILEAVAIPVPVYVLIIVRLRSGCVADGVFLGVVRCPPPL